MIKQEYKEAQERDEALYDKSILSHDDNKTGSMKYYEFSIMHRNEDDSRSNMDDYE